MENKINIIKAVTSMGVAMEDRIDFLFTCRQFIKDLLESNDISLQLEMIIEAKFKEFQLNNITQLVNWSRSILKNKNQSFGKLLISLVSNYLNMLKYDNSKHLVLYYPNNEYWNDIGAIKIDCETTIEMLKDVYFSANSELLESTEVVVVKNNVKLCDLKIKTTNNYEASVIAQKITNFRNELNDECDSKKLYGNARKVFIKTKVDNYKKKLNEAN